jgi:hypothetical protein
MDVRSYRTVFELERRIYRIDRFRLNPAGVPLRGVAYFVAAALVTGVAHGVPVAGWVTDPLPWYIRYIGLPLGLAAALSVARIDGRPFHVAAWALWNGSRRRAGCGGLRARPRAPTVWMPGPLIVLPDGSDPRMRRFRFRGPGAMMIRAPHRTLRARGPRWGAPRGRNGPWVVPLGESASQAGTREHRVISVARGATTLVEGEPPS